MFVSSILSFMNVGVKDRGKKERRRNLVREENSNRRQLLRVADSWRSRS